MSSMTVNTAELRKVANELTELNGQYQQRIGSLIDDEAELSSMWEGPANTAFRTQFAKSCETFNSFSKVIAEYVTALTEIAVRTETEEGRAESIANN